MNVLLINHYAGSSRHGMEYRPYYLAREWQKLGHRTKVVAASWSHVRVEPPATRGSLTEENVDGIPYVWLKTPRYRGNSVGRVVNILAFVLQLYRHRRRLVRDFPPDAVIASSTYPLDVYPAHRIARSSGARLIYEVHDLWPLTPIELGGISPYNPFIFALQRAEDFACRRADRVVSILPKAEGHLREHGMAPEKFVHVPNGVDVDSRHGGAALPEEHAESLARLKREGRFVVGYAGGHGVSNALDAVLAAAEHLRSEPVAVVLVGQGPEKESLRAVASRRGLDNVIFLPPVAKGAVPRLLAEFDALFIGWQRRPIYRFGISPNKLFDYMLAAKPVVHAVEAANDPVAESGCGISCPPEDPVAIAGAVRDLARQSPAEREAMGRRGREYVLKHHSYPMLARRFLDAMGALPTHDSAHTAMPAEFHGGCRA